MGPSGGDYLHYHHPFKGKGEKLKGQDGEIKQVLIGKHLRYNRIFVYLYFYCAVCVYLMLNKVSSLYQPAILKGHGNEADLSIFYVNLSGHGSFTQLFKPVRFWPRIIGDIRSQIAKAYTLRFFFQSPFSHRCSSQALFSHITFSHIKVLIHFYFTKIVLFFDDY